MSIKTLCVSDNVIPLIYSLEVRSRYGDVELVLSCGDLPYYYLEYIISTLDVPLFYVRGNHDSVVEHGFEGEHTGPLGGVDLHGRFARHRGLIMTGIEGSLRYSRARYQYTQNEMWYLVLRLIPRLLVNRLRFGRYLDVLITHAPPWGIHDREDYPHRGIKAFRWLIRVFQPAYHLHGHIHVYQPDTVTRTELGSTQVINVYGSRVLHLCKGRD